MRVSRGRTCGADSRGHAATDEDAEDAEEAEGVAPARPGSLAASQASKLPFLGVTASLPRRAIVERVPHPSRTHARGSVPSVLGSLSSPLPSEREDTIIAYYPGFSHSLCFYVDSNARFA